MGFLGLTPALFDEPQSNSWDQFFWFSSRQSKKESQVSYSFGLF